MRRPLRIYTGVRKDGVTFLNSGFLNKIWVLVTVMGKKKTQTNVVIAAYELVPLDISQKCN